MFSRDCEGLVYLGHLPAELPRPANFNDDWVNDDRTDWLYDYDLALRRLSKYRYDTLAALRRSRSGPDQERLRRNLASLLQTIQTVWQAMGDERRTS